MHRRVTRKEKWIDGVYLFFYIWEHLKICRRVMLVIINNIKEK
jgi:hypothetical protein